MYPHRIFITGDSYFNNFFLFSYYMENYITDQSILYTTKPSPFDPMADVFASGNNLTHLSCRAKDLIRQVNDKRVIYTKIANATDLLLIYGAKNRYTWLTDAFKQQHKKFEFIDVLPNDAVTFDPPRKNATVSFSEVFGPYLNKISPDKHLICYKFLIAMTRDLDLLTLVIQHKKDIYATENNTEQEIAQNLYWIYKNQYASLVECRKKLLNKPVIEDEHLLTDPYEWKYEGENIPVFTGTGLKLAKSYSGFVRCNEGTFVEIADKDLLKSHVYKALRDLDENEDDDVRLNYHTSDHQSYPLFYQAYHFDGSPIKMGYWYINPNYVKVK